MAKRLKRNVTKRKPTKRNMKKRKPTKRLKRTQRKRIYRGGSRDIITSTTDLQQFLNDTIPMLKPGDKVIFQVANKDGGPIFNTYDTTQLDTFINNSKYTVYGMIEGKDKVD